MARLSDIANETVRKLLGNRNLNLVTLAINAASAATIKSTGAINYLVNGVLKTKAALSAQSIAITHGYVYVQPANKTVYYTLGLNAAGTVCVVQGSYAGQTLSPDPAVGVGVSKMGATWVGDGSIPDVPDGYTPFGVLEVATGATTFTPGTTALDAANVTVTYHEIAVLPDGTL